MDSRLISLASNGSLCPAQSHAVERLRRVSEPRSHLREKAFRVLMAAESDQTTGEIETGRGVKVRLALRIDRLFRPLSNSIAPSRPLLSSRILAF